MAPESGWFNTVYEAFRKRRPLLPAAILGVTGISVACLWLVPFDTTLDLMLPAGSEAQRMLRFVREASFADKVVISVEQHGAAADPKALAAAADELTAAVGPPLITGVVTDFSRVNGFEDALFFARSAPQILNADDLAAVEASLTPAAVKAALNRRYDQLLRPEGMFMGASLRSDPLGIRARALGRLRQVSESFGYDVSIENGHLISRDGRHAMIIMETPVAVTDGAGSRRLLGYLRERIARLPAGLSAQVICGHTHTVSNEHLIKRDIALTNSIGSAVFIALLLFCFRQVRSVMLIFLIPVFAALVAIPLTALIVGRMALLVVGLGSVIAGIAVDYGMHVYVAARHSENTREAVRHVATPVFFGSLTIVALFAAFFFSTIEGYHQLAWFSILGILISIGCAIFVFPHFVRPLDEPEAARSRMGDGRIGSRRAMAAIAALWSLTILAGIPLALRVRFDPDVTRLDGVDGATREAEADFHRVWGRGENGQALIVISGTSLAEILETNDRIFQEAADARAPAGLISLAGIWPSERTRRENAARWKDFWDAGRTESLRALLAEEGPSLSFSADAFAPFFQELGAGAEVAAEEEDNALLSKLKERFISARNGRFQVTSFFPDRPSSVEAIMRIAAGQPGAAVISGKAIGDSLSESFSKEVIRISVVAVVLIAGATFLLMRNVPSALIALMPPVTAVVWLLAVMACFGATLNVATLIAGIVVFGLSVDYSFVMMHSYRHRLSGVTRFAVHLSAITTVVGTAALLFARHPALFAMGVTLTVGVTSGYIAAVFAVPAMCELFLRPGEKD